MSKLELYKDLQNSKSIIIHEFTKDGEAPYTFNVNNIISDAKLFDDLSLCIETYVKINNIEFDKVCAANQFSMPYATNIATSFQKGLIYIANTGNDIMVKNCPKNLKIEGVMEIDEKILLIDVILESNYLLNNIYHKITKFGGIVSNVIIIFDKCEGESINLIKDQINVNAIINIYDFCNTLECNKLLDLYYCEKIKFYCEKTTKENIKKSPNISPNISTNT